MKQNTKLKKSALLAYVLAGLLFVLFFIYVGTCEKVEHFSARGQGTFDQVTDYQVETVEDAEAPLGIRQEYRWTLGELSESGAQLIFYLVHQYAEVRLDGELIASLKPAAGNRLTHSISSNWLIAPLYASDAGRTVTVTVTPMVPSALNRVPEFQVGMGISLLVSGLNRDMPQLVLALICCLLGLFMVILQGILFFSRRQTNLAVFYWGQLAFLLGIWRMSDTRTSSLLFPWNPVLLGYLSIGMLFLSAMPLMLSMWERFTDNRPELLWLSLAAAMLSIVTLLLQVLGVFEMRQLLVLSHCMMIICIAVIFYNIFTRRRFIGKETRKEMLLRAILLSSGALIDLIRFYVQGNSASTLFTILMFDAYTAMLLTQNILNLRQQVYSDGLTGLVNKRRWDELMEQPVTEDSPVALVMMDLNGLKDVNDTMGHDMGDRMLMNFAALLRGQLPINCTICRWGGDEFTAMLPVANLEKAVELLKTFSIAVEEYNRGGVPEIHFAAGVAHSGDYPGLSRKELLAEADKKMYINKQNWYKEQCMEGR